MAFARGELSYSKVRALARAADRHNEDELLAFAVRTTASRVEERCRERVAARSRPPTTRWADTAGIGSDAAAPFTQPGFNAGPMLRIEW